MARSFNGSSDVIISPARVWPQSGCSFSCWVLLTSAGVVVPFCAHDDLNSISYMQCFTTGSNLQFRIHTDIANYIGRTAPNGTISTNVWTHIGLSWTGGSTNASCKIYVNGTQADTADDAGGSFTSPSSSSIRFFIGAQQNNPSLAAFWPGSLADLAVWNVKLSAEEIYSIARGGLRPYQVRPGNIVADHRLDGYNHPAMDYSVYKRLGVLTGTAFAVGPPLINPVPVLLIRKDLPKRATAAFFSRYYYDMGAQVSYV